MISFDMDIKSVKSNSKIQITIFTQYFGLQRSEKTYKIIKKAIIYNIYKSITRKNKNLQQVQKYTGLICLTTYG